VPAGINNFVGIGNMTADPMLKEGQNEGSDRCEFSIAINKPGDNADVTFLDCVAWGKLANQIHDFGRKGRLVAVTGEVEVRRWETDDGEKRKIYRIKAYQVRFLDPKPQDATDNGSQPTSSSTDFDDLPF